MHASLELHVRPHEHTGRWVVGTSDGGAPISSHETADEAERRARAQAAAWSAAGVVVHDRYHRIRRIPMAAAAPR